MRIRIRFKLASKQNPGRRYPLQKGNLLQGGDYFWTLPRTSMQPPAPVRCAAGLPQTALIRDPISVQSSQSVIGTSAHSGNQDSATPLKRATFGH